MLVPRGLGHVFQHSKSLLNGPLSLGRQLLPLRQNIVFDMTLLLGRHFLPITSSFLHLLLLLRWQSIEFLLILQHALLVFFAQILKTSGVHLRAICVRRTVRISAGIAIRRGTTRIYIRSRRILRLVLCRKISYRICRSLRRWLRRLRLVVPLRRTSLFFHFLRMKGLLLRKRAPHTLRRSGQSQSGAERQGQQTSTEFESKSHRTLHLLMRTGVLLIHIVLLHRLGQIRQGLEV